MHVGLLMRVYMMYTVDSFYLLAIPVTIPIIKIRHIKDGAMTLQTGLNRVVGKNS
jgi:hypothetical protein